MNNIEMNKMKTESEILEICKSAKIEADRLGDNWADFVDNALTDAGLETDEQAARKMCNRGKMNVVAVLADGRVIECRDDGEWTIEQGYTSEDIALSAALSEAANEEGTIQAGDMLRLAPHHRPELHTTMSVSRAFEAITGKSYDTDFFCD